MATGNIKTNSLEFKNFGTVSVASDTNTSVGSITLDKGLYLIQMSVTFSTNATGYRTVFISTTSDGTSATGAIGQMRVAPPSGAGSILNYSVALSVTSAGTYYIIAYQNSGSTLSVYPRANVVAL